MMIICIVCVGKEGGHCRYQSDVNFTIFFQRLNIRHVEDFTRITISRRLADGGKEDSTKKNVIGMFRVGEVTLRACYFQFFCRRAKGLEYNGEQWWATDGPKTKQTHPPFALMSDWNWRNKNVDFGLFGELTSTVVCIITAPLSAAAWVTPRQTFQCHSRFRQRCRTTKSSFTCLPTAILIIIFLRDINHERIESRAPFWNRNRFFFYRFVSASLFEFLPPSRSILAFDSQHHFFNLFLYTHTTSWMSVFRKKKPVAAPPFRRFLSSFLFVCTPSELSSTENEEKGSRNRHADQSNNKGTKGHREKSLHRQICNGN